MSSVREFTVKLQVHRRADALGHDKIEKILREAIKDGIFTTQTNHLIRLKSVKETNDGSKVKVLAK